MSHDVSLLFNACVRFGEMPEMSVGGWDTYVLQGILSCGVGIVYFFFLF